MRPKGPLWRYPWPAIQPSGPLWRVLAQIRREVGHQPQLLFALVVVEGHRRDDEGFDSRVAERPYALFGPLRTAGDADRVDRIGGERQHRLALPARPGGVLHLLVLAL